MEITLQETNGIETRLAERAETQAGGGGIGGGMGQRSMSQESTTEEEHTVDTAGARLVAEVTTKKHDLAIAAINPDLANITEEHYVQRFAPKSSGGKAPTITFKDLETWELWARQDPMHTGTMHYVAVVLPGCGELKGPPGQRECIGAGDVTMEYCTWAKPGPINEDGYDTLPGAVNSCDDHAPWMQPEEDIADYKRTCGAQIEAPLIVGSTFQHRFNDAQEIIERLRVLADEIDGILDASFYTNKYEYEVFSNSDNFPNQRRDFLKYVPAFTAALNRAEPQFTNANGLGYLFYKNFVWRQRLERFHQVKATDALSVEGVALHRCYFRRS